MLNKATIIGYVGKDPEVRTTPGGTTVANFSVATSRKWKDRDGERQESTEWHNCVAWGKTAEVIGEYVGKGSKLYVEGRLETQSWEDKNHGDKRYKTQIVVDRFIFLDSKGGNGNGGSRSKYDDDIPF